MNESWRNLIDQPRVLSTARAVLLLAFIAYLLLSVAEQGGIGSDLSPVPQQPLPFERGQVFGLDLTNQSSTGALRWISAARPGSFALVRMPVDAEITFALANETENSDALAALDKLVESVGDVPLALCVRKPIAAVSDEQLAKLALNAFRDRYPGKVAYVDSCASGDASWQTALTAQLTRDISADADDLLPLTVGAVVKLQDISSIAELTPSRIRQFSGASYVAPILNVARPLNPRDIDLAQNALEDAAQLALVMLRPLPESDPAALSDSVAGTQIGGSVIPEGYSSVQSPIIQFDTSWTATRVGTVDYIRTETAGAQIQLSFVGTALYVLALLSPDAGELSIWVDPKESVGGLEPDQILDLGAVQAQDGALALIDDLPAAQHQIVISATNGEATVSGFFVSGRPESGWNGGLTALGLIACGVVALTVLGMARIRSIRRATRPPEPAPEELGHRLGLSRDD